MSQTEVPLPPVTIDPPRQRAPAARPSAPRISAAPRAIAAPRRVAERAPRPARQVRQPVRQAAPVAAPAPGPAFRATPSGTEPGGARAPVPGYVASRSVVATKTDTPIVETAQSVSVVGRKQIDDQVPLSITQALRYTPGIVTEQRGGSGSTRNELLTIRGFIAPTLLDGLRLPANRDAFPTVDPFRAERIDVVKGPSSTLYGQSGPGGIVDIISKTPRFVNHGEVFLQGGGFSEIKGGFDIGGPVPVEVPGSEQFAYRLIGLGWEGEGPALTTRVERKFISPSFTWQPSADTSLTLLGHYQEDPFSGSYGNLPAVGTVFPRNFGNGIGGRFPVRFYVGDRSFEKSDRVQGSIGYIFDHRFSDNLRFHSAGRFLQTEGVYQNVGPSTPAANGPFATGPLIPRALAAADVRIQTYAVDNYLEGKFDTGPVRHTVLLGFDHYHQQTSTFLSPFPNVPSLNALQPNNFLGLPFPGYSSASRISGDQTGVYLQDQMALGGFRLTLGGRFDSADQYGPTRNLTARTVTGQDVPAEAFTGRASLLYLFESGFAPYVSYSEAFEPIVAGRIFDPALGSAGRIPDPIKSRQVEGGLKYQPPGTDILLTAAVFDITRSNALAADPVNLGFNLQTAEVGVQGVEFEARANLTSGLSAIGGVAFLDARNRRDTGTTVDLVTNRQVPLQGLRPTLIPDSYASLFLDYKVQDGPLLGLSIGGGVRYNGPSVGDPANRFEVPGSVVVDALVRYDFRYVAPALRGLELQVNALNLLDERYVAGCFNYANCNYGYPRTVFATLRYRW